MGSGLCRTCSKADAKPRQKPIWEREITSREDALQAVHFAAYCYFGLAALDFIVAGFGQPFLYLTAIVIAVCASLVWAIQSRVAAVTLLGLFIFDIIVLAINWFTADQRHPSYAPFILLLLQGQVTIQAVRATFKLHKEYRLAPDGTRDVAANGTAQIGIASPGVPTLPPLTDASSAPLPVLTVPPPPAHAASAQGYQPATSPESVQKISFTSNPDHSGGVATSKRSSGISTAPKRFMSWLAVMFNQRSRVGGDRCPLWNPLGVAAYSLILTPLFGSALVYFNWMRLGRIKRARIAALWFWGSVGWLLFLVFTPATWHPPLWAYLIFLGAWFGLVAYPQHLSLQNRFAATGYLRAAWTPAVAAGSGGLLLLMLVHAATNQLYQPTPVLSNTNTVRVVASPAESEADHLFSAEEITQRYRNRIVEVGVAWKEASGMWFWKSENPAGSQGSGLLLANDSAAGLIVTNYHVVAAPDSIVVGSYQCAVRQDASQSYTEALCIARAKPPLDLALLVVKMNDKEWTPDAVQIQALENLHQGESVVAIGNALGEGISTTNGVISHFDALGSAGRRYIRTSTPISPGNSGGPLFTARGGFLAGITTATRNEERAQNYNVAIPGEYVLEPDNWDFANSKVREMAEPLLKAASDRKHR